MTRLQLIRLIVGQARANGFEFRKWFVSRMGVAWPGGEPALQLLASERRYYALLFSHEFARSFWKAGEDLTFTVAKQSFQRRMADGTIGTVSRKAYIRRSARTDAWLYHLRELAASDEPLRYIRRYVRVADELDPEDLDDSLTELASQPAKRSLKLPAGHPAAKDSAPAPARPASPL